jgi:methanogenic corrinoid protein MtbC1
MIKWCAYCQKFSGEIPPFENLEITHGICSNCRNEGVHLRLEDFDDRIREVKNLLQDLREAGSTGDLGKAIFFVERGIKLGIRPIDLAAGLLAPSLYHVGHLWECGTVSVEDQQLFSRFADEMLSIVRARSLAEAFGSPPVQPSLRFLSTSVPGNTHVLGPQILEVALIGSPVLALNINPPPVLASFPALLSSFHPDIVGLSVSMPEQKEQLSQTIAVIRGLRQKVSPEIIVGGYAVKTDQLRQADFADVIFMRDWPEIEKLFRLNGA